MLRTRGGDTPGRVQPTAASSQAFCPRLGYARVWAKMTGEYYPALAAEGDAVLAGPWRTWCRGWKGLFEAFRYR